MKKFYPLIALILLITVFKANAQSGFSDLLKASPADANKLLTAYGQPLFRGFGADMNSGWTNTAKTKKLLHVELRITASGAFTPTSDKTFDVTKIGLSSNVRPADDQSPIAQTIGGNKNISGPIMNIYKDNQPQPIGTFTIPSGKLPIIPAPQVQLTIGLVQNTDVTLRLIPKINAGDAGSISMIGFGVKHDITKYLFGPAKKIVPFDLSILLAYSRLNLNASLDVKPDDGTVHDPNDQNKNTDFSNQHTDAHFTSFLAEAIISKRLLFFTPFLAVGYNTASTNLAAIGNYPVPSGENAYDVFTNPVNIHETSISGMRADIGFQLNLGIRIYASASLAQYKSVNAGIGFGF